MTYRIASILILALFITSCASWRWWEDKGDDPIEVYGPSDKDLKGGAKKQGDNTEIIDKKAKKIQKETKEPETKKDIKDVIVANDKLKENNTLLIEASLGKKNADVAFSKMKDKYLAEKKAKDKIQEKYDGKLSAFLIWFKIIGSIMIPLGIVGMVRIKLEWGWLAVLGFCILISSMIVEKVEIFIDDNSNYIIAVIIIAVIAGVWRVIHQYSKPLHSAVKRADMLKAEVKKLDKADGVKDHKTGTKIVEKVFGEYHNEGMFENDSTTKKMINNIRKKFKKENDPL